MRKKKLSISLIILAITVFLCGTAVIAAANAESVATIFSRLGAGQSRYDPPAQRSCTASGGEELLEYQYTTEIDENSLNTPVNPINGAFVFHTYATSDGGSEYLYDSQNRLYAYSNTTEHPDYQASALTETACGEVMEQFLADNGIDSTPYTQRRLADGGMQYQMSIPSNGYQRDEITGSFLEDGSLFNVIIYHNDVTSVTESEEKFFEKELEKYLSANHYTDAIAKKSVSYRRIENTLVAYYSLTFQDSHGGEYGDCFVIGKDKLFW